MRATHRAIQNQMHDVPESFEFLRSPARTDEKVQVPQYGQFSLFV
jgi:hypothetical protein